MCQKPPWSLVILLAQELENGNHAQKWGQICWKVFNCPEFHSDGNVYLSNWYFSTLDFTVSSSKKCQYLILFQVQIAFTFLCHVCCIEIELHNWGHKNVCSKTQVKVLTIKMASHKSTFSVYFLLFPYPKKFSHFFSSHWKK